MNIIKLTRLLFIISLLTGCHQSADLKPSTEAFTVDFAPYREQVTLTFQEPMIPVAMDDGLISISPPLDCLWVWLSDRHLRCQLSADDDNYDQRDNDVLHNTRYAFRLNAPLETVAGQLIQPGVATGFRSQPGINDLTAVQWLQPNHPILLLSFDTPIHTDRLTDHSFSLIGGGHSTDLNILPFDQYKQHLPFDHHEHNVDPNRWLFVTSQEALQHETTYQLSIQQALQPINGHVESVTGLTDLTIRAMPAQLLASELKCNTSQWYRDDEIYEPPCYLGDYALVQVNRPLIPVDDKDCPGFKVLDQHHPRSLFGLTIAMSELVKDRAQSFPCLSAIKDLFGAPLNTVNQLPKSLAQWYRPKLALTQSKNQYLPINQVMDLEVKSMNVLSFNVHVEQLNGRPIDQTITHIVNDFVKDEEVLTAIKLPFQEDIHAISGYLTMPDSTDQIPFNVIKAPFHINIKTNLQQFSVMLHEANTLAPLADATITLNTPEHTLHATTNAEGLATLNLDAMDFTGDSTLDAVTMAVETQGQTHVFDNLRAFANSVRTHDYDPNYSSLPEGTLVVWGITDKPLYRAGERVKYQIYLREKQDRHFVIPSRIPTIQAAVHGHNFQTQEHMECELDQFSGCNTFYEAFLDDWDEFGGYSGEFTIPKNTFNGEFSLQFSLPLVASDDRWIAPDKGILSDVWFQITDFKASPYLLSVSSMAAHANNQQPIKVTAQATYYSGGPVVGEMAEITTQYEGKDFTEAFPEYQAYTFYTNQEFWGSNVFYGPLTYDENGQVTHEFTPAEDEVRFGHIKINSGIKPQGSGWTYSKDLLIPYHSQPYFVGLKTDAHYQAVNEPINLETILVDYQGQRVDHEGVSILAQPLSGPKDNRPKPTEHACPADQPCALILEQPGRYQLQVKVTKAGHEYDNDAKIIYVSDAINPYAYEADKTTRIVANQDTYQVGDVATIEILFPDNQVKSAVFIERNQVLNAWHKTTDNGTIQVSFEITEDHSPGFSVNTAILTLNNQHKHQWPKPVKEITQHFTVESQQASASFSFATDQANYQPGEDVVIDIHSEFNEQAEFTVAVIDEAVISFVNPSFYYELTESNLGLAPQAWEAMDRFELYPFTFTALEEPEAEAASITVEPDWEHLNHKIEEQGMITVTGSRIRREDLGAFAPMVDAGFLAQPQSSDELLQDAAMIPVGPMRLDPRHLRTLFKESAHFHSGIQVSPGQSTAYTFKLPDNMGSWRVVVVGTDRSGLLDIQHQNIQASKPLELYATLPDQLTVGDRFEGRLAVVSKSEQPSDIELAATAQSNQASLAAAHEQFNGVQANRQYSLSLPVNTEHDDSIQVLAMAQDDQATDGLRRRIPVRKAEITVNQQQSGQFSTKQHQAVFKYENPVVDSAASLTLQVSPNLFSQLQPTIEYMKNYPHACWEQKLSKAVATLVELKLDTTMSPADQAAARLRIHDLLQQAVNFQASNGGMTFFNARQDQVNAYLTFHTHHLFNFFVEQGFEVPRLVHQELAAFAEEYMETYHYFVDEPTELDDDVNYLMHPELYLLASGLFRQNKLAKLNSSRGLSWSERRLMEGNQETLKSITDALDQASLNSLIYLMRQNHPALELSEKISQSYFKNGTMLSLVEQEVSDWQLMNSPLKSQCLTIDAYLNQSNHAALKSDTYQHILAVLGAGQGTGIIGSTLENSLCLLAIHQFIETHEEFDATGDQGKPIEITVNDQAVTMHQERLKMDITTARDTAITIHNPEQRQWYYSAQVAYPVSAKTPAKVNFGLDLKRTHQRFTAQGWQDFAADDLATGDWIKTQLLINNPTDRSFIALSSPNPGAWLPVDITLSTTVPAGLLAQDEPHWNSPYFYQRQLLPDTSLFYADHLPAGLHRVTYYSQVQVAGEFSLLPAQVEAMYNREISAQTAYQMVRVK